jgi:hypothetical protein
MFNHSTLLMWVKLMLLHTTVCIIIVRLSTAYVALILFFLIHVSYSIWNSILQSYSGSYFSRHSYLYLTKIGKISVTFNFYYMIETLNYIGLEIIFPWILLNIHHSKSMLNKFRCPVELHISSCIHVFCTVSHFLRGGAHFQLHVK